jgi:hypothetical protein
MLDARAGISNPRNRTNVAEHHLGAFAGLRTVFESTRASSNGSVEAAEHGNRDGCFGALGQIPAPGRKEPVASASSSRSAPRVAHCCS